jgi:nucleoid DNA-binding protein
MKDKTKNNNPKTVCLDDMVDIIAMDKQDINKPDIRAILDLFKNAIIDSIKAGNSVYIVNGWSFELVPTKAKELRNPKTGAIIKIPDGIKIRTRISQKLKAAAKEATHIKGDVVKPKATKTTAKPATKKK